VLHRLLGRDGDDRYLQSPADRFRDLSYTHALFGDRVISFDWRVLSRRFLQREPIEPRDVEPVRRRPAVVPLPTYAEAPLSRATAIIKETKPCLTGSCT
jgi:hypothetical protein